MFGCIEVSLYPLANASIFDCLCIVGQHVVRDAQFCFQLLLEVLVLGHVHELILEPNGRMDR